MKIALIVSILLLISCLTSKDMSSHRENKHYEGLVRQFKIICFERCQNKSNKNKCEKYKYDTNIGIDIDISYSHDYPLGRDNYQLIDSLSTSIRQKIHIDSLNWTNEICKNCDDETLQRMRNNAMIGKRTLAFCLDYYTSNELDSIARVNVKKYIDKGY